jgi:hypothetical protein
MDKQKKILIILAAVFLVAAVCLLVKDLAFNNKTKNQLTIAPALNKKEVISHNQLVANYKSGLQPIVNDFDKLLTTAKTLSTTTNDDLLAQTAAFKTKLEELVVPAEFKDLHLDIFYSVISLEDFYRSQDQQALQKSQELWQKVMTNNSRLKTETL